MFGTVQSHNACTTVSRLRPRSVSVYSTRGGACANSSRCTSPQRSSSRSVWVSILLVTPSIRRRNSPCRLIPAPTAYSVSTAHRFAIRSSARRDGQAANSRFGAVHESLGAGTSTL